VDIYSCTDSLSGMAPCAAPVANGASIDTGTVGAKTFAVNDADKAGNTARLSRDYSVQYKHAGFLPPVDALPVLNVARAARFRRSVNSPTLPTLRFRT
jgi:hypothetical protein